MRNISRNQGNANAEIGAAIVPQSAAFTDKQTAPISELKVCGLRNLPLAQQTKFLEQAYQIYVASFPDPDERLSRQGFERYVTDPKRSGYDILVALHDGEVIAASNYRVIELDQLKIGYQSYIYTRCDMRAQGIGSCLFDQVLERMRSQGASAMFGEMNDPFVMSNAEIARDRAGGMDPYARRAMWMHLGRFALDAPYVQPGFEGGSAVRTMLLNFKVLDRKFHGLSGAQYIHLLDRFFEPFIANHKQDPDYKRLVAWAEQQKAIALIPLDQKRTFI